MANRSRVITMSPLVLNHEDDLDLDLDLWEVVNPSDGEFSDDSFSVDSLSDDDVISLDDASFLISPPPQILPVTDVGELPADLDLDGAGDNDDGDDVVRDQVDDKHLRWAQRRMVLLRRGSSTYSLGTTLGDYAIRGGFYGDCDSDHVVDDGEYDDSYDLDEELVPRSVCKKLGRQRMRKIGKRAIAKVLTSKTSPYSHLKPGSIRGKHGLGLKFKC